MLKNNTRTYYQEFQKIMNDLVLRSSISIKDLLHLLSEYLQLVKKSVPWQVVELNVQSPDGVWIAKRMGKSRISGTGRKVKRRSDSRIRTESRATKQNGKEMQFNIRYEKEKILECTIIFDEMRKTPTRKLMNEIQSSMKLLAIEGYKLISNQERVKQHNQLAKFSSILNSMLEPKEIQRKAMEAIINVVNSEVGSLLLLDETTGELKFEVALGEKEEQIKEIKLKKGEGIAGWVALHEKALLINDCRNDRRFASVVDQKTKFATRNMICVPVKVKNKLVGVLQAINKKNNGRFNKDDLKLLASLSEQVAIALENARLFNDLQQLFIDSAQALAEAIEKRDPYTGGHIWRVVNYSLAIANYLDMGQEERFYLKLAAILHDIGKIGIDDSILRKPAPLDHSEFEIIKQHPALGAEIIKRIKQLEDILPGVLYHHERHDGKGYPFKLKDKDIPLIAKIIAIADTFDAICSSRPYRLGLTAQRGKQEVLRCSGTQFDPEVVKAFVKAFERGDIEAVIEGRQSEIHQL